MKCNYPEEFGNEEREICCMCGERVSTCPHTAQQAMNHYVEYHNEDCDERGHSDVAMLMMMEGAPAPKRRCRHCNEVPKFGTVGSGRF